MRFGVLGYWGIGVLGYWGIGVLGYWGKGHGAWGKPYRVCVILFRLWVMGCGYWVYGQKCHEGVNWGGGGGAGSEFFRAFCLCACACELLLRQLEFLLKLERLLSREERE